MSNTSAPVTQKGHILIYEGIKGLACLLIMLVHYRFTTINFPAIIPYIGLHAFFGLSAFLISKNLFLDKERYSKFSIYYIRFYIKRTLRIFPIYFFYLFVIALITVILMVLNKTPDILTNEWKNFGWLQFVFLSNFRELFALIKGYTNYYETAPIFVHLWSISLEEQFYLFIVLVVFFISKDTLKKMAIIAIIVFPFIRLLGYYWLINHSNDTLISSLIVAHTPMFQFDVFFYGMLPNLIDLRKFKNPFKWALISLVFLILWSIGNAIYISAQEGVGFFEVIRLDEYVYRNGGIFFIDSIANFCILALILTASWYPEKLKIFTTKFWVTVGAPSFSIYVFQFFFLIISFFFTAVLKQVFFKLHLPIPIAEIIGCLIFLASTIYCSTYLFRYIEIPMFKLKDKFLHKVS